VFRGFIVDANNEHTGILFGLIQVMAVLFTIISVTFIYWFIGSTLSNSHVIVSTSPTAPHCNEVQQRVHRVSIPHEYARIKLLIDWVISKFTHDKPALCLRVGLFSNLCFQTSLNN